MEIIKDIAAVVGCILSVISLVVLCTKGGRAFIVKIFSKNTAEIRKENEQQSKDIKEIKETLEYLKKKVEGFEEVSRQQCRNIIKNIYYSYQKDKKIPLYERKTADAVFNTYSTILNGNSYVTLLYGEICKWEIDTVTYQDLNEE